MPGLMWLDEYERTARLAPGLLVLAPVVAAVGFLGLPVAVVPASLVTALLATVGPMVLAKYVGNRGRAAQDELFAGWGGPPTTLMLVPRLGGADPLCAQRRSDVERLTGVALPHGTPLDAAALAEFDIAVRRVRAHTSAGGDKRVFVENKSYGFERNLWGVRREGRGSATFALLAVLGAVVAACFGHGLAPWPALLAALAVEVALGFIWVLWPTRDRVRDAGDRYAERLLDSVAVL